MHSDVHKQTVRPANERKKTTEHLFINNAKHVFFLIFCGSFVLYVFLEKSSPYIPSQPIPSSHPTCQVRRRVDLDLKAHDAFLVGREKNCDVILEGLEMLGVFAFRFSVWFQLGRLRICFFVYQILLHQILVDSGADGQLG